MISMIKTLLKSVRQYKKPSIITPIFMIVEAFCECLMPFFMSRMINEDALQSAGAITNDGWNQIEEITTEFDVDEKRPRVEITIVEVEDGKCYSRGTEIQFQ